MVPAYETFHLITYAVYYRPTRLTGRLPDIFAIYINAGDYELYFMPHLCIYIVITLYCITASPISSY